MRIGHGPGRPSQRRPRAAPTRASHRRSTRPADRRAGAVFLQRQPRSSRADRPGPARTSPAARPRTGRSPSRRRSGSATAPARSCTTSTAPSTSTCTAATACRWPATPTRRIVAAVRERVGLRHPLRPAHRGRDRRRRRTWPRRFGLPLWRFANSGTEATMDAVHLMRAVDRARPDHQGRGLLPRPPRLGAGLGPARGRRGRPAPSARSAVAGNTGIPQAIRDLVVVVGVQRPRRGRAGRSTSTPARSPG